MCERCDKELIQTNPGLAAAIFRARDDFFDWWLDYTGEQAMLRRQYFAVAYESYKRRLRKHK